LKPKAEPDSFLCLGGLLEPNFESDRNHHINNTGGTGTNRARLERKADEIKLLKKRA